MTFPQNIEILMIFKFPTMRPTSFSNNIGIPKKILTFLKTPMAFSKKNEMPKEILAFLKRRPISFSKSIKNSKETFNGSLAESQGLELAFTPEPKVRFRGSVRERAGGEGHMVPYPPRIAVAGGAAVGGQASVARFQGIFLKKADGILQKY